MFAVICSIVFLLLSALFPWLVKEEKRKIMVACGGTIAASIFGIGSLFFTIGEHSPMIFLKAAIPGVIFAFAIDPLSVFFLIIIFGLSIFSAIYGIGYLKGQKRLVLYVPFFPLLVASMAAVTISRDALSFIIFWEMMSLSSFFLVTSEHEDRDVQTAGWIYLIATHLATAFLMAFFLILAKQSGSLLFKDFAGAHLTPFLSGLIFIFALIGFGTKAGIFPFHVWLPHAHPAAPSYISALMSGAMIKTGIYGILRTLTFIGPPPMWWGTLLIALGILSAILGVLYALMQHNLKRLLAYHSIENIGIIVTGIGIGLLGLSTGNNFIAALGFAGALFHVLNHAVFKGLLFLGAGSVFHAAKILAIDDMGGLLKKMPVTGISFLIGALSICGLPPFNGFASEWLIYIGLFNGGQGFSGYLLLLSAAGLVGIAFAGGLAVACFTKVFGIVFLGESRRTGADCHESPSGMLVPMLSLSFLCLAIGLFPSFIFRLLMPAVAIVSSRAAGSDMGKILSSLNYVGAVFAFMIVLVGVLVAVYYFIFRKKSVGRTVTWDCGYAFPTARMQYTAASFAEPIGTFFRGLLMPVTRVVKSAGYFASDATFSEHVEDFSERGLFANLFSKTESALLFIREKKKNTIQSYLALIFITLIVIFIWEVWIGF